jgi:hypothetical protein
MSHEKGIEAAQDKIYDVVSVDYGGLSRDSDAALQIVKAYLDASGMVMVPREPTSKMLNAAAKALSPGKRPTPDFVSVSKKHMIRYQAMVNAAPNPFTSKSNDDQAQRLSAILA